MPFFVPFVHISVHAGKVSLAGARVWEGSWPPSRWYWPQAAISMPWSQTLIQQVLK